MLRRAFWFLSIVVFAIIVLLSLIWPDFLFLFVIVIPIFMIGVFDVLQRKHNVLRNYPLIGHFRYMFESIRPQIRQYFIESNQSGMPFSRENRSLVYERASKTIDTLPFGTQRDVHDLGFDWVNHSMSPTEVAETEGRIMVGGPQCSKPYSASRLNVSAMSFGALSKNAVRAINRGANLGNFAQNTGEGGLSPYHLEEGGDVFWQIASGYFGCRTPDGDFDPHVFQEKANHPNVKMIEIKISQGAKPSHGGMLPAAKITPELSEIRGVPMGKDCLSPASHKTFSTPVGLLKFVAQLRELSHGKPVGFKLCIGIKSEFLGICKAMLKTGIYPDFITIDGSEGGTGAAPVELTDYVGTPLNEGLVFAHNSLVGVGLREHIRLIGSGKVITGFDMVSKMALGADMCNSARGMLFAVGCIQSRRCNTNLCPTGVTTQDPRLMYALSVKDKAPKVANFHSATIQSFLEVLGVAGVNSVAELTPEHMHRRLDVGHAANYREIYTYLEPKQLLEGSIPDVFAQPWADADPDKF